MNKIIGMDFKEFDKLVKKYYPLNEKKSRYLIEFYDGSLEFYKYKKEKGSYFLYKEKKQTYINLK